MVKMKIICDCGILHDVENAECVYNFYKECFDLLRERITDSSYQHPNQKPTSLAEYAIQNSSKRGDIVLDVFGGSGSTLIAAEKTGRICYMMEIDPAYCDVIRERYENYVKSEKKETSAVA